MKTFSDLLGFNQIQELTKQEDISVSQEEKGVTITSQNQTPKMPRASQKELTACYLHDRIAFNGVNKMRQTIMNRDNRIEGTDASAVEYVKRFISNLGKSGSDIGWEEFLGMTFHNTILYGWDWNEIIWNTRGNIIMDWQKIDTDTMDYAKDSEGKVVLDVYGNPVGFVQCLEYSAYIPTYLKKYPTPKGVSLSPNQLFFPTYKIGLIKLYSAGDKFYPIGLVEPTYKSSLRKLNMEEAMANSVYRVGFPVKVGKVGDEKHPPTPAAANKLLKILEAMDYKSSVVTEYFNEIQLLEPKGIEDIREDLNYFTEQQVTGMGIPMPFATGLGTNTDRSTLEVQSYLYVLTLKDIIKTVTEEIRRKLFKPLLKSNPAFVDAQGKLKVEVPTIVWDDIGLTVEDDFARRLKDYQKAGVVLDMPRVLEKIYKYEKI